MARSKKHTAVLMFEARQVGIPADVVCRLNRHALKVYTQGWPWWDAAYREYLALHVVRCYTPISNNIRFQTWKNKK